MGSNSCPTTHLIFIHLHRMSFQLHPKLQPVTDKIYTATNSVQPIFLIKHISLHRSISFVEKKEPQTNTKRENRKNRKKGKKKNQTGIQSERVLPDSKICIRTKLD